MDIKQIVLDLYALSDEQEWFEFKENWFQPEVLGGVLEEACSQALRDFFRALRQRNR